MKQVELTPDLPLDRLLQQAQDEDIVIMRQGHAVALLSEFDDDELYWYARERDPGFVSSIAKARTDVAAGRTTSHEDLKRQLGLATKVD